MLHRCQISRYWTSGAQMTYLSCLHTAIVRRLLTDPGSYDQVASSPLYVEHPSGSRRQTGPNRSHRPTDWPITSDSAEEARGTFLTSSFPSTGPLMSRVDVRCRRCRLVDTDPGYMSRKFQKFQRITRAQTSVCFTHRAIRSKTFEFAAHVSVVTGILNSRSRYTMALLKREARRGWIRAMLQTKYRQFENAGILQTAWLDSGSLPMPQFPHCL